MVDVDAVRGELENVEKDALVELIVSGKLPENLENAAVTNYLEENCLLRQEDTDEMDDLGCGLFDDYSQRRRHKVRACHKRKLRDTPPEIKNLKIAQGDFYWRNYIPDKIPEDAVSLVEGQYIGQVNHYENLLPVVIFPKEKIAIGERSGKRVFHENIRILCAPDSKKFYWQEVDFDQPTDYTMKNVVKGGYQDGYDLYIGKGSDPSETTEVKIGKVVPLTNVSCKGLQVWGDYGECVLIRRFHILKYGSSTVKYEDPVLTDFHWRDYVPNNIPQDAIEGSDGKYIGQISCFGDIPVTINPKENEAVLEEGGRKTVLKENIRILCSDNRHKFYWESIDLTESLGKVSVKNAVAGGYQDGSYLFVGRTSHEGEWKIGKVVLSENIGPLGLNVWDKDGNATVVEKFEILKYDEAKILNK